MSIKVVFNLITRNNADSIVDCLNSTLPAEINDYVFCDTGSTDNTVALILEWGLKNKKNTVVKFYKDVYGYEWNDENFELYNFGQARQIALKASIDELHAEYMIWLDSDDVLEHPANLLPLIQDIHANGIEQVLMPYRYGVDQQGNDLVLHYRERIIKLVPYVRWTDPVHEVIDFGKVPVSVTNDFVKWRHKRKPEHVQRTQRRNREILRHWYNSTLKQNLKPGLRLLQNLAYDHFEHREFHEAIEFYKQFMERFGTLAPENNEKKINEFQVVTCLTNWANSEAELGNYERAEEILNQVKKYDETDRAVYFMLCEMRIKENKLDGAMMYLKQAQSLPYKPSLLPINQIDIEAKPHLLYAEIFKRIGNFEDAIKHLEQAQRIVPYHKGIEAEKLSLIRNIEMRKAFEGYFGMKQENLNSGDWKRIKLLLDGLPHSIKSQMGIRQDIKSTSKLVNDQIGRLATKLPDKKKRIAIYTGQGYEEWAGDSRENGGIGGSEEMVIGIAKELSNLGNEVFVYNSCGSKEGDYDGVHYIDYKKYRKSMKFDILIISRLPQSFIKQSEKGLEIEMHSSTRQYLWLHDVHYGDIPTAAFGVADKIMVVSEYHKDILKSKYHIEDDKFLVTRNGIDVDHYEKLAKPKRNLKKIIYCSSYDRGLYEVLVGFKKIKEQVSEAELSVFYGWNTYDKRMKMMPANYSDHPSQMSMREYKKRVVELMDELGVKDGGRINQEELLKEMRSSSVWYYDTWFSEVSCITAMRAQYAGCIPVCTPVAALNETVKKGFLLEGDKCVEKVIDILKNPKEYEELRKECEEVGKDYSLSNLAKEWISELK